MSLLISIFLCPENKVKVKNGIISAGMKLLLMAESRRVAPESSRARISSGEFCKNNDVLLLSEMTQNLDSTEVYFCTLYKTEPC